MGFKGREILPLPNRDGILQSLSPEDIFHKYLGYLPKQAIKSPLREEKMASFSLFMSDKYRCLMYRDFATGDIGDCFVFVKRLYSLSNMNEVYNLIAKDFMLSQFEISGVTPTKYSNTILIPRKERKFTKSKFAITYKLRKWIDADRVYWNNQYGLRGNVLEYCNVYPISHFFINGQPYIADKLAYVFIERKDSKETCKIYQPKSKIKKWINNNDFSTWELWTQLPRVGKTLIITSSRKDAMVIKTLFVKKFITSCSLQSEGVMPKKNVVDELKNRFQYIYIMYDNDFSNKNPGRTNGKKLCDTFGFKQIEIPDGYNLKDPSDFREQHGHNATRRLILDLIKQN